MQAILVQLQPVEKLPCSGVWVSGLFSFTSTSVKKGAAVHAGRAKKKQKREAKQPKSNNVRKMRLGCSKNPEVLHTYTNLIPCEKLEMSDRILSFSKHQRWCTKALMWRHQKASLAASAAFRWAHERSSRGLNKAHSVARDTANACDLYF